MLDERGNGVDREAQERQLAAFRRLLTDGSAGGQAKVDALLALTQRTVYVVPWTGAEGYRTLVNSDGVAALPIFTDRAELKSAAQRFGWLSPDGTVAQVEVGARQALSYARNHMLAFVVIDIAAAHSLELARDEFEPLLSPAARRESQGPFVGAGRTSSTLLRAVRATPTPMPKATGSAPGTIRAPTPPPGSLAAARASSTSGSAIAAPPRAASASSSGSLRAPEIDDAADSPAVPGTVIASTRLGPLAHTPDDALLESLEALLRDYPEVEWGCLGSTGAGTSLGLRVDPRMRKRVDEIASKVARSGLPVVLLDDAQHMRAARQEAFAFYPWRRR